MSLRKTRKTWEIFNPSVDESNFNAFVFRPVSRNLHPSELFKEIECKNLILRYAYPRIEMQSVATQRDCDKVRESRRSSIRRCTCPRFFCPVCRNTPDRSGSSPFARIKGERQADIKIESGEREITKSARRACIHTHTYTRVCIYIARNW